MRIVAYLRYSDKYNEDNLIYTLIQRCGHEERSWVNALYNTLQLFFREDWSYAADIAEAAP